MSSEGCSSPCVKCTEVSNTNGLFTCRGCQQNYCLTHTTDHRTELYNRFGQITNTYDSIQEMFQIFQQRFNANPERLSYQEQKISEVKKAINTIKEQLITGQKYANYSEKNLDQWECQLNKLKTKLTASNPLIEWINAAFFKLGPLFDLKFVLTLVFIILFTLVLPRILKSVEETKQAFSSDTFGQVNGPILLFNSKHVAVHNGLNSGDGSFRVSRIYSSGVHRVRLQFERFSSSYTFVGIIRQRQMKQMHVYSSAISNGWFISNGKVTHNDVGMFENLKEVWTSLINVEGGNTNEQDVRQGDTFEIEIDCEKRNIALKNERTNKKYEHQVDLQQYPLPWQIIINLDHRGDRVRLRQ